MKETTFSEIAFQQAVPNMHRYYTRTEVKRNYVFLDAKRPAMKTQFTFNVVIVIIMGVIRHDCPRYAARVSNAYFGACSKRFRQ